MPPVPTSNRAGVFPRSHLAPGENVIFETRPSFGGYSWGRLLIYGFFLLIFLVPLALAPLLTLSDPAWWSFFLLFVILIVHRIYVWSRSAYALTDRRVLSTAGFISNGLADASVVHVQNVTVGMGVWKNVTLHLGPSSILPGVNPARPTMVWYDVPHAAEVATFVGQTASYLVQRAAQATAVAFAAQQAAIATAQRMARTVYCQYCGSAVDLGALAPGADVVCPSCGAPLGPRSRYTQ